MRTARFLWLTCTRRTQFVCGTSAILAVIAAVVLLLPAVAEAASSASPDASGTVTLPHFFGNNMIFQQNQRVPIWGWAAANEKVTVAFAGQRKSVKADPSGRWKVWLNPLHASAKPSRLVVVGSNRIVFTNVLVGEVWLCSGQSNMEKPLGHQRGQKPVFNYRHELSLGNNFPQLRLFKVHRALASAPQQNVEGQWAVCSSNSLHAMKFSAAAYFYGRYLARQLEVPVGLIESSWGGTCIEPWTPAVGFRSVRGLSRLAEPIGTRRLKDTVPMAIYNAMIAPLATFAMRGVIWYQGESNCIEDTNRWLYTDKTEALVNGWRKVWKEGVFPFYYVQIAPHYYSARKHTPPIPSDALPIFWEAQTRALRIRKTGMVVTTDLVDNLHDIHPRDKQDVGKRLALVALAKTYGRKGIVYSGPMFKRMTVQGDHAVLSFSYVDGGLISKDGKPLTWFTIAGRDKNFVPARAVIQGDTVVVSSPKVKKPVAVRFAWSETAEPNFFNRAGLPAVPFRTDANP